MLLGVRAVIAESFERIHRSNLIGMGVLPLQFTARSERPVARADRTRELRHQRLRSGDARTAQVIATQRRQAAPFDSRCACASIRPRSASTSAMAASCSTCCVSSRRRRARPEGGARLGAAALAWRSSISTARSRDTTRCCRYVLGYLWRHPWRLPRLLAMLIPAVRFLFDLRPRGDQGQLHPRDPRRCSARRACSAGREQFVRRLLQRGLRIEAHRGPRAPSRARRSAAADVGQHRSVRAADRLSTRLR